MWTLWGLTSGESEDADPVREYGAYDPWDPEAERGRWNIIIDREDLKVFILAHAMNEYGAEFRIFVKKEDE